MLYLDPIVDNADTKLEETYKRILPECEEVRIATGYFYLSGFDLYKEDLANLADPEGRKHAPFRILMGRQTDERTAEEIEAGQTLRQQFQKAIKNDIDDLNNAQLERLDRLRDFIAEGLIDVRVRDPEQGYFHAKGACFRAVPDDPSDRNGEVDRRPAATVVGSSNFSRSGHRNNIELNLTSQDSRAAEDFEEWYDNQWANAEEFSEELIHLIETSRRYQEWKDGKEQESNEETDAELGSFLEPFELYKLLAYDALGGNVSTRDSPLYYFQTLGYESAREKLAQYNGCIISDSVGLGKSFIGGELLYEYRQHGKRGLVLVPANLTDQWIDLLETDTDEAGTPYFGLEVDGTYLDVMSISRFQNLTRGEVKDLRERFDVILIDEAHRFRNYGKWRPDTDHEDGYKGTRRHANLRLLRGKTMIMLTATPINNSATDLKNLISLFTGKDDLQNKASLDFDAFDDYIELSTQRKRIAAGKIEASEGEKREITKRLRRQSEEISKILNEVMILRTRKNVKEKLQDDENLELSFNPPTIHKRQYSLPRAYQPIYDYLPDVMDALHLPHITIKNPKAGSTLKALYKLNLLKRLESSTYAFVQSVQTLHESERSLLGLLERLPEEENIDTLRKVQAGEETVTLEDFVEDEEVAHDLEQTLEEFGFDTGAIRADRGKGSEQNELADATVGEVKRYIHEDLTLLAYFLQLFISDVARHSGDVSDHAVSVRHWLHENHAGVLPDVPEDERNPSLYPRSDLSDVDDVTREFYQAVFQLREFRDPKVDELAKVLRDSEGKVLIFTQYRATADYVYRTLRDNDEAPLTASNSAVVKGGDENKQDIIRRFAPEAAGYQRTLAESDENELTYVVATDTLSEGVNLQDIHIVVNYDLPWNPMRIVQRVGRIDRIGSTANKYVHNFYPDGDIETAIRLLKRLQAKINDIALIVGKENSILDPNEDEILERAGIETEKTIGELEIEEIETAIRKSRAAEDYNELDDVSTNPLLRNAGSNEDAAFERYLLKKELNEEYGLDVDDFEYAEEYFEDPPEDREFHYTHVSRRDSGPQRPGVFALAHMWSDDETDAPLGRTRRAFYYLPFGDDEVKDRHVRMLQIAPNAEGEPLSGDVSDLLAVRATIEEHLDDRLSSVRLSQKEGQFKQGDSFSKEQETLIQYLQYVRDNASGELTQPDGETTTVSDRAEKLRGRLTDIRLKNTDEDRILRKRFRGHPEYERYPDWPMEVFFDEIEEFLDEVIGTSTEYQETLVKADDVHARLLCWGVVSS